MAVPLVVPSRGPLTTLRRSAENGPCEIAKRLPIDTGAELHSSSAARAGDLAKRTRGRTGIRYIKKRMVKEIQIEGVLGPNNANEVGATYLT